MRRQRTPIALFALFLCSLLIVGCVSIRPMAHLGLLAPFEGLHRRSGYAALDAVRAVVATLPTTPVGWLPLAVDVSLDPPRDAQKLLVNPSVAAIVGPLHPAAGYAVAPAMDGRPWRTPYAISEAGWGAPGEGGWAEALVRSVAEAAVAQGTARLQIVGWEADWPSLVRVTREGFAPIPAIFYASLDALDPGDALLWLGGAADGARFITRIRRTHPDLPVWVGPWLAADGVFGEHLYPAGTQPIEPRIYSIAWLDAEGAAWAQTQPSPPLYSYLVERAAQAALSAAGAGVGATAGAPTVTGAWRAYPVEAVPGALVSPTGEPVTTRLLWRLRQ